MKLSELIQETLNEIAVGVKSARDSTNGIIAIAPEHLFGKAVIEVSQVEFDVSLIVSETDSSKTEVSSGLSGEIKVATIFGIKGKAGTSDQEDASKSLQNTHRVSFKIPICLSQKLDYDYGNDDNDDDMNDRGRSSVTGY